MSRARGEGSGYRREFDCEVCPQGRDFIVCDVSGMGNFDNVTILKY